MSRSRHASDRALAGRSQLVILLAAALAVLVLFRLSEYPAGDRRGRERPVDPPAAPGTFRPSAQEWAGLKLAVVRAATFQPEVVAEGHIAIDADRTTPVFPPYSGRVVEILAKSGQSVARGAPLMAVEAPSLVKRENDLIAAVAALGTARAKLALAQAAERRTHALYLAKGAALKDWQQKQADLIAAQNKLRAAEIALAAARNRLRLLGLADSQVAAIENAPTARLDPVGQVRAPIGGIVTERRVGLGEYIKSGGSKPVYTIGDLSTVWLVAQVRESDAARVRVGEPVAVRVLAYPGRVFRARLSWVAPAIDPKTHRLPVRADVGNPDGALKPRMFARFHIATGPARRRPAVPEEAIVQRGARARVWVAGPHGTLAVRTIRTGAVRRGMVEVLSGLTAGERVISGGSLFIDRAARGG